MREVRRILVSTDFSPDANAALGWAVELAQRLGARLEVVHVAGEGDDRTSRALLDETVREIEDHCLVETHGRIVRGDSALAILGAIADAHPDLVVLGTGGGGGAPRPVVLGSVAERVVKCSPCPVLTVRADQAQAGAA